MQFELSPREGALTCSYCLSELAQEGWSCEGCGVRLHHECSLEVKRCPTVGCGRETPGVEASVEAIAPEPSPVRPRANLANEEGTQQFALYACAMLGGLPGTVAGAAIWSYVEEVGRLRHWSHETRAGIVVGVVSVVWVLAGIGIALIANRVTGYPKRI